MKLRLKVVPGASRDGVEWLDDEHTILKVRVTAPPEKGKANKAVAKLLADLLGIPNRAVSITSGAGSQQKIVAIAGIDETGLRDKLRHIS